MRHELLLPLGNRRKCAWLGVARILLSCGLVAGCGAQEGWQKLSLNSSASSSSQQVVHSSHETELLHEDEVSLEWGFSSDKQLNPLPPVCSGETPFVGLPDHAELADSSCPLLGILLSPLALPEEQSDEISPLVESQASEKPRESLIEDKVAFVDVSQEPLSAEERHLLKVIARDALAVSTGAQTDVRLDQQSREKIQEAFALAQRGASYAARQELIEVLRMISLAKDNRDGSRCHSESLAAGLRALEEAEDFVPRGTQLEAEMALEVICTSHRTPLAREADLATVLPSQLMDRYNRYAQIKLAWAVAGEPAGSMGLYTLGKLNSQLGAVEPEKHRMATRRAVAFQQAALLAHNQNYLAAHELGILLAETGHLSEACQLLSQVARREPHAIVFRNLARVHHELGQVGLAHHCQIQAARLVEQGRGPAAQVAWVSPEQFGQFAPLQDSPQMASRETSPVMRY